MAPSLRTYSYIPQIWDTAGQETFRAVTRSYYRGAEGCLLVFDVHDRRSFLDLHVWLDDLKQWAEEDVVIMMVGNKSRSIASWRAGDCLSTDRVHVRLQSTRLKHGK